jgi:hypothetical protein
MPKGRSPISASPDSLSRILFGFGLGGIIDLVAADGAAPSA